jgi:hypothetical protein
LRAEKGLSACTQTYLYHSLDLQPTTVARHADGTTIQPTSNR